MMMIYRIKLYTVEGQQVDCPVSGSYQRLQTLLWTRMEKYGYETIK